MSTDFTTLLSYVKRMQKNLLYGYTSFIVWKTLKKLIATNIVGEERAKENVAVMNRYPYFLRQTLSVHRDMFVLELTKMFDRNKNSLSLRKIIKIAQDKKEPLNKVVKNITKYNKGITDELIKDCNKMLDEGDKRKQGLKKLRDTIIAHTQIEEIDFSASMGDIERLFKLAAEILRIIYTALGQGYYLYDFNKEIMECNTRDVIGVLRSFEPVNFEKLYPTSMESNNWNTC